MFMNECMEIHQWDDEIGQWLIVKKVDWPVIGEEDRRFLWWKWKVSKHIPVEEYCKLAVAEVKEYYKSFPTGTLMGVRLWWTERQDTIWQNGNWRIQTNTYRFYIFCED